MKTTNEIFKKDVSKRYLFFDIESSIGRDGHICEFGYIVTDENLNKIAEENILMSPKGEFSYRVLRKILNYSKNVYEKQKPFTTYYDFIRELFLNSELIFGFATVNDVKYINEDCYRFNKKYIDYEFYDIQQIVKMYDAHFRNPSLEYALNRYHIDKEGKDHDALADANNTLQLLKYVIDSLEVSVPELIKCVSNTVDKTTDGVIESMEINKLVRNEAVQQLGKESNRVKGKNRRLFDLYVENKNAYSLKSNEISSPLYGKKICISLNYEQNNLKQMLNIVDMLSKMGAQYITKASLSDIFVKDPEGNSCCRLKHIENERVEIIEFDDFLNKLDLTMEELDSLEMPNINIDEEPVKNDNATLGDLFKDFFKEVNVCI